ncbi:MAG: hypothetical protein QM706_17735 [Nitrospira sp.]
MLQELRLAGETVSLRLSFWTPQTIDQVHENLWRVNMAAIDKSGKVIRLLPDDIFIFSHFQRKSIPEIQLSMNYQAKDVLIPEYEYEFEWTGFSSEFASTLDQYCSSDGRVNHATSVWFEDIVGHVSTAEQIEFLLL